MRFARGFRIDDGRAPRANFTNLRAGLASATPRGSADLDPFLPAPLDQNRVGSCVPSSMLMGVVGTLATAHDQLGFIPSVATAYPMCLALDRAADYPKTSARDLVLHHPLADHGTMLMTCAHVLADWGVVPMGKLVVVDGAVVNSDCGPEEATREVALNQVEKAATRLIVGAFEMVDAMALGHDLKLALDHGVFVAQGGWVDTSFEEYRGGAPIGGQDVYDRDGGGHAVLLTGYRETPSGTIWRYRNSWNAASWGIEGRSNFEATDDFALSRWETVCLSVRKAV